MDLWHSQAAVVDFPPELLIFNRRLLYVSEHISVWMFTNPPDPSNTGVKDLKNVTANNLEFCVRVCSCKVFKTFVDVCPHFHETILPQNRFKKSSGWQGRPFSYLNKIILDFSVCLTLLYPFNIRACSSTQGYREKLKGETYNGLGLACNSCSWIKMQHYTVWPRLVRVSRGAVTGTFQISQLR